MGLSCSCGEWDGEPGTWAYFVPDNFHKFELPRRKRCSSCNALIDKGSDCLIFPRVRSAYTEIEERIKGEEIEMPALYMCEKCGEQYLNLSDIGYCIAPTENVMELLKEYHYLTGFKST